MACSNGNSGFGSSITILVLPPNIWELYLWSLYRGRQLFGPETAAVTAAAAAVMAAVRWPSPWGAAAAPNHHTLLGIAAAAATASAASAASAVPAAGQIVPWPEQMQQQQLR